MSELGRREFLEVSFSFVAGVGLLLAISCDGRRETADFVLARGFQDPESLAAVGRRYLETAGEDPSELVEALDLERGWDALDEEIRGQYDSGDVVLVDGWLLARTEARIYGLFAARADGR